MMCWAADTLKLTRDGVQHALLVSAALSVWICVSGCSGGGQEAEVVDETQMPYSHAMARGLEVRWWLVQDGSELGAALAEYQVPVPAADAEMVTRWRANGFRLVMVPVEDLTALRSAIAGRVNRQWFGERPRWTVAIDGPRIGSGSVLSLESGPLRVSTGWLRLLLREWAQPTADDDRVDGALVRVELVPQYHESGRDLGPRGLLEPLGVGGEDPMQSGQVFDTLKLDLELRSGMACLIVPESPIVEWQGVESEGENREEEDSEESADEGGDIFGPPGPAVRTIGAGMLCGGGQRAVVVLVPRVPERFSLFERVSGRGDVGDGGGGVR